MDITTVTSYRFASSRGDLVLAPGEKILAGGCDGFIAKPISIPSFLATVAQFLGETS